MISAISGLTTTVTPGTTSDGQLVEQRLAAAGRHDREQVLAREQVVERLGLAGAERLDAERLLADAEQRADLLRQSRALGRDRAVERVDRFGGAGTSATAVAASASFLLRVPRARFAAAAGSAVALLGASAFGAAFAGLVGVLAAALPAGLALAPRFDRAPCASSASSSSASDSSGSGRDATRLRVPARGLADRVPPGVAGSFFLAVVLGRFVVDIATHSLTRVTRVHRPGVGP